MEERELKLDELMAAVLSRASKAELVDSQVLVKRIQARWLQQSDEPLLVDRRFRALLRAAVKEKQRSDLTKSKIKA